MIWSEARESRLAGSVAQFQGEEIEGFRQSSNGSEQKSGKHMVWMGWSRVKKEGLASLMAMGTSCWQHTWRGGNKKDEPGSGISVLLHAS